MTGFLQGIFRIVLCVAKEVVREVVPGERTVERVIALGVLEPVLGLLVEKPAATHLELMAPLGPRHIVANLITVGHVVPWHPVHGVVRAGGTSEVDRWDAVVGVLAATLKNRLYSAGEVYSPAGVIAMRFPL